MSTEEAKKSTGLLVSERYPSVSLRSSQAFSPSPSPRISIEHVDNDHNSISIGVKNPSIEGKFQVRRKKLRSLSLNKLSASQIDLVLDTVVLCNDNAPTHYIDVRNCNFGTSNVSQRRTG